MGLARRAFAHASVLAATQCAFFATSLSLSGCSSSEVLGEFPSETCDFSEVAPSSQKTALTIASFWSDKQESPALGVLQKALNEQEFEVIIDTKGRNNRIDTQQSMVDAFRLGRLPDVFQVNGGSDLLRWVTKRQPDSANVCSLNSLAKANNWQADYFPRALGPVTCNEHLYGLPIGVHRLNNLFYNHDVFGELQALAKEQGQTLTWPEELKSLQDLLDELKIIQTLGYKTKSGAELEVFAVTSLNQGPLTILAFENVLLSLGQHAYETLWRGDAQNPRYGGEAQLRATLSDMVDRLRELVAHARADTRFEWQEALRTVGRGDALFTVNGDWGWAQLIDGAAAAVRTTPFPGTGDAFVYTPDSFAVPRELEKNGFAARAFLEGVLANKDVLLEFSNLKHSLPPRTDLDDTWLDMLATDDQRENYQRFKDCSQEGQGCRLLLAVSGLAPPPGEVLCYDDIEPLLRVAVAREVLSDSEMNDLCPGDRTKDPGVAKVRLIELLIAIGNQPFAADCR